MRASRARAVLAAASELGASARWIRVDEWMERASIGRRVAIDHRGQQRHARARDAARLRLSRPRRLRDCAQEVRHRAAGELRTLVPHPRRCAGRELRGEADRLDGRQRVVEQRGERALSARVAHGDAQEAAHHLRVGPARRRGACAPRVARAVDHGGERWQGNGVARWADVHAPRAGSPVHRDAGGERELVGAGARRGDGRGWKRDDCVEERASSNAQTYSVDFGTTANTAARRSTGRREALRATT